MCQMWNICLSVLIPCVLFVFTHLIYYFDCALCIFDHWLLFCCFTGLFLWWALILAVMIDRPHPLPLTLVESAALHELMGWWLRKGAAGGLKGRDKRVRGWKCAKECTRTEPLRAGTLIVAFEDRKLQPDEQWARIRLQPSKGDKSSGKEEWRGCSCSGFNAWFELRKGKLFCLLTYVRVWELN